MILIFTAMVFACAFASGSYLTAHCILKAVDGHPSIACRVARRMIEKRLNAFHERAIEKADLQMRIRHGYGDAWSAWSFPRAADCHCKLPPMGWMCTRKPGHDGPCAATLNVDRRD